MENTVKALLDLGLNEKEAQVYLAGLELGFATAQQLAAKAAVVRPTAYVAIGGLVKRGLMSQVTRGKKQFFQLEKPDSLTLILDAEKHQIVEREMKLKAVLPIFNELFATAGHHPETEFYNGEEELAMLLQIFAEAKPKLLDLIVVRQSVTLIETNLWLVGVNAKVRQINVRPVKVFSNLTKNRIVRDLIQPNLAFDGEVVIFNDRVALVLRGDRPCAVLIHGADLVGLVRLMFEGFWASLA